jgi:hypothetical protein
VRRTDLRAVPDLEPCGCCDPERDDKFWSTCWCDCHQTPLSPGLIAKTFEHLAQQSGLDWKRLRAADQHDEKSPAEAEL